VKFKLKSAEEKWVEGLNPQLLLRRRERTAVVAGGLLLIIVVGFLAYLSRPRSAADLGNSHIRAAAENGVRVKMQAAGLLRFNAPDQGQVVSNGNNSYTVRGWVQDVTSSGLVRSYYYYVDLDFDPKRGIYMIREVNMAPQ
jgi:hypothetical protein